MIRALPAGALLTLLTFSSLAMADPTVEDRALADQLYGDAGKLAQGGDYAGAKKKLEASLALDPGIGTLIRLSWCEEKLGNIASAWTRANEAEAMALHANDKRAKEAAETAKRLEPLVSKVVLRIAPVNRADGFTVSRDGVALKPGALDAQIPLDPGEHTFDATRPGKLPWKTTVTIKPVPGVVVVDVPALQDAPTPAPSEPASYWNGQRIAGATMGAVGVVGLAVGSALTAIMVNENHASMVYCPTDPNKCYAPGVSLRNDALDAAHAATGTFIAGAALAAGGLVVFLTAPKASPSPTSSARVAPVVGPTFAGASLAGAW